MSGSAIVSRGVDKTYPGEPPVVALESIDLSIQPGEFVSILGPSGCGKSTFLRCIAGLERITGGTLTADGVDIDGPPPNVGMAFQRDALLEWRTVERNILLPIEFAGKSVAQARPQMQALLELTGLSEFAHRMPRELSGGMRQRAAICRALINQPGLLLMDEPFGALDALTRDQMNVELQRIWSEVRNTVVFVTHGIAEAVFLADRVAVLSPRPGRIVEVLDIELPRPRRLAVRETEAFGAYTSRIRALFHDMGLIQEEPGPAEPKAQP